MNVGEMEHMIERMPVILVSLRTESDRGCVLVVSTMVEHLLEQHILRRLLPKASSSGDELMSMSAESPISSFSAKINLAFRPGLIAPSERTIFHQLRELRNACAHKIEQQHFAANHFKDRIKNIINLSQPLWESLRNAVARQPGVSSPPSTVEEFVETLGWRYSFEAFFAMVIAHKEACLERVPTVPALYVA
ncbi:MAG: hypothetical protein ABIS30_04825 [Gallionella sp.]|jgi:hypothetical protein